MKKIWMFILCLGMGLAVASCGAKEESSSQASEPASESVTSSADSSTEDSSSDSTDSSSSVTPPIINGENELPLVPVG